MNPFTSGVVMLRFALGSSFGAAPFVSSAAQGALEDLRRQTMEAMREILGDDVRGVVDGTGDPSKLRRQGGF